MPNRVHGRCHAGWRQVALAACEVAGVAAAIGQTVAIVNLNKTFGEYTNGRKMESILTGLASAAASGWRGRADWRSLCTRRRDRQ